MHFSVQLPTHQVERGEEFASGAAIAEMARAVEGAGFDGCFVTDHPFPAERWVAAGGHHALDPFVTLSFAAAATTRLRLQTNILVLPYRNPFLTAKAAASLDALSGGRLVLGVAAGYLKPEFAALGADFEGRNERTDEAIDAMHRAWTGAPVDFEGRGFVARGNAMLPRPVQRPHPPLWVGGNSRRAIRRAAERGQGWIPFPTGPGLARHARTAPLASLDDLRPRVAYLRSHAAAVGRSETLDICTAPFGMEAFGKESLDAARVLAGARDLARLGVTWLMMGLPAPSRAAFCEAAARFGADVIAQAAP